MKLYLAAGIVGFIVFGAVMVWADNHNHPRLARPATVLTLLCFPAIVLAGIIIMIGSIGLG